MPTAEALGVGTTKKKTQKGAAKTASKGTAQVVSDAIATIGPTLGESSTVRKAATQQARAIQKYVTDREKDRLERKHYTYDSKGRIEKVNATQDEIRKDLQEARTRAAKSARRLYASRPVQGAITAGRVLDAPRLAKVDKRQRVKVKAEREAIKTRAHQIPGPRKEARAWARKAERSPVLQRVTREAIEDKGEGGPLGIQATALEKVGEGGYEAAKTGASLYALATPIGRLSPATGGLKALFAGGAKEAAKRAAPAAIQGVRAAPFRASAKMAVASPLPPALTTGGAIGFVGTLGQRQAEAWWERPGKTTATTLRTALALPAAVMGDVADVGTTATRAFRKNILGEDLTSEEVLAPLKQAAESQSEYWKSIVAVAGPDVEESRRIVQEELGLVPLISGGLGVYGVVKATGRKIPTPEIPFTLEKQAEKARINLIAAEKSGIDVDIARKEFRDAMEDQTWAQTISAHRRQSELAARYGEKEDRLAAIDMAEGGQRKLGVGPREQIDQMIAMDLSAVVAPGIRERDVISVLARLGIGRESKDAHARIKTESRALGVVDPEFEGTVHTARVMDALIENPRLLKDERIHRALDRLEHLDRQFSIERHSIRTGKRQTTPDPLDEAPRRLHAARMQGERGVLTKDEMTPPELRHLPVAEPGTRRKPGETKVRPKPGQDIMRAFRAEAKGLQSGARKLRKRAEDIRKGRVRRGKESVDELEAMAAQYDAEAQIRLAVTDRYKDAEKKIIEAERIDDGQREGMSRADAQLLRVEAERLMEEADAVNAQMLREFIEADEKARHEFGDRPAIWMGDRSVADAPSVVTGSLWSPGARAGSKERYRTGSLVASGMRNESGSMLLRGLYERRAWLMDIGRRLEAIAMEAWKSPEGRRFLTEDEWETLAKRGQLPPGMERVQVRNFAATIQRNDKLAKEYRAAQLRAVATAPEGKRQLYMAWSKPAYAEFKAQEKKLVKGLGYLRTALRIQTGIMLGTSPTWFAYQMIATPIQMAFRNMTPTAWARASKMTLDAWTKLSERERAALFGEAGANPADFLALGDATRGMNPKRIDSFQDHLDATMKTPAGKAMLAPYHILKKGGPLVMGVRRVESVYRAGQIMLEIDRASGTGLKGKVRLTTKMRRFMLGSVRAHDTMARHLEEMKGLRSEEKMRYYLDNPEKLRELGDLVRENYGEWAALSSFERKLSAFIPFYGFLRMSLRWFFYAAPKNHPIRYAIALNMAQQNAQELSELMGGDPAFYSSWGKIVLHNGPEGEASLLDLARAAPGGNVLVETLGGADEDSVPLALALRAVQPALGIPLLAMAHLDVYGRPSELNFGELLLKGAANLSPFTRDQAKSIGAPQSRWSKLYAAMSGKEGLKSKLTPALTPDVEQQQKLEAYQRLLDQAFDEPYKRSQVQGLITDWLNAHPDQNKIPKSVTAPWAKNYKEAHAAFDAIDKLMIVYGVETKEDQKEQLKNLSKSYAIVAQLLDENTQGGFDFATGKGGGSSGGGGGFDFGGTAGGGGGSGGGFDFSGEQGLHKQTSTGQKMPAAKELASRPYAVAQQRQKGTPRKRKTSNKQVQVPNYVPPAYRATIARAAKNYNVPAKLLAAQLQAESNFDPNAGSSAGAQGIAQFMPATAAGFGIDPMDPEQAIEGQARFMRNLLDDFGGNIDLALAGYNAGPGAAEEALQSYPETQAYVAKIRETMGVKGELVKPQKQIPKTKVTRLRAAKNEARAIDKLRLPYEWGGGHTQPSLPPDKTAYDCSGVTSRVLQAAGYDIPTMTAAGFMTTPELKDGPGALTIYAKGDHVFMKVGNRYFGTSHANPEGGAGFIPKSVAGPEAASGQYLVRHVPGLGKRTAAQLGIEYDKGLSYSADGSTATITSGVTNAPPGFHETPPIADRRASPLKLLRQIERTGKERDLNILTGTARARTAPDETLAALAQIAETRSRLLGRSE